MRVIKLATFAAAVAVTVAAVACKGSGDTTVKSVDTVVTTTKVRDTTVVKADTTVHVDTVKNTHHVSDAKKP
ncbi:MAG: hypothetical protein ABI884_03000 [Gemmatimonadota bacterium]